MTARRRTYVERVPLPPTAKYVLPVAAMERILAATCRYYEVEPHHVLSDSRLPEHVLPRHVVLYLCVRAGATLQAAGRLLGRDHSTVNHALRRVEGAMNRDPLIAQDIADLSRSQEVAA